LIVKSQNQCFIKTLLSQKFKAVNSYCAHRAMKAEGAVAENHCLPSDQSVAVNISGNVNETIQHVKHTVSFKEPTGKRHEMNMK
jgi:hypothetical protein